MTFRVSIVVGNPKPRSRTRTVAEHLVRHLLADGHYETHVVDLADYSADVLTWPNEKLDVLNAMVANSDVAVFASPTYKATYTGLLKAFLDRYPADGLAGVTAIPVMTGAGLAHALGPTVNLAPLLAELGALIPGRGMYFDIQRMDRIDELVAAEAKRFSANLSRLGHVARHVAAP
jgi:FMN reductase